MRLISAVSGVQVPSPLITTDTALKTPRIGRRQVTTPWRPGVSPAAWLSRTAAPHPWSLPAVDSPPRRGRFSHQMNARRAREKKTVACMAAMYCLAHHSHGAGLCPDCESLLTYSFTRIDACMFGEGKPVCSRCSVHCYRRIMRDRIREVMRFSGPRMILRHPILAARHLLDSVMRGAGVSRQGRAS